MAGGGESGEAGSLGCRFWGLHAWVKDFGFHSSIRKLLKFPDENTVQLGFEKGPPRLCRDRL